MPSRPFSLALLITSLIVLCESERFEWTCKSILRNGNLNTLDNPFFGPSYLHKSYLAGALA